MLMYSCFLKSYFEKYEVTIMILIYEAESYLFDFKMYYRVKKARMKPTDINSNQWWNGKYLRASIPKYLLICGLGAEAIQ